MQSLKHGDRKLYLYLALHCVGTAACGFFYDHEVFVHWPWSESLNFVGHVAGLSMWTFPVFLIIGFRILRSERARGSKFNWYRFLGILDLSLGGFQWVFTVPGWL